MLRCNTRWYFSRQRTIASLALVFGVSFLNGFVDLISPIPTRGHESKHRALGPKTISNIHGVATAPFLKLLIGLATDKGSAGRIIRILLPAAFALIGLSGTLLLVGHRAGIIGIAVGAGVFAVINAAIVTITIFWCALLLHGEQL